MITDWRAPRGKIRIIGISHSHHEDYLVGDFSLDEGKKLLAKLCTKKRRIVPPDIYCAFDDRGEPVLSPMAHT